MWSTGPIFIILTALSLCGGVAYTFQWFRQAGSRGRAAFGGGFRG